MRRCRSTLGQASLLYADANRALTRAALNITDMPGLCKPSCCRHTSPTETRCSSNTGSPACWHTSHMSGIRRIRQAWTHTSGIRRIRQSYVANRYALQLKYRQPCVLAYVAYVRDTSQTSGIRRQQIRAAAPISAALRAAKEGGREEGRDTVYPQGGR